MSDSYILRSSWWCPPYQFSLDRMIFSLAERSIITCSVPCNWSFGHWTDLIKSYHGPFNFRNVAINRIWCINWILWSFNLSECLMILILRHVFSLEVLESFISTDLYPTVFNTSMSLAVDVSSWTSVVECPQPLWMGMVPVPFSHPVGRMRKCLDGCFEAHVRTLKMYILKNVVGSTMAFGQWGKPFDCLM